MTVGDDSVFSRWSRRKLAARKAQPTEEEGQPEAPGADAAEPPASGVAPHDPAPAEASRPAGAEPVEAQAAAEDPLPRIEDLQADSDLSAFLRQDVPAALRNLALRKMWSVDPAIRDHVGLAEYAWDFNDPTAMAGFGPLEAGSRVVDFLSTTGRSVLAGASETEDALGQASAGLAEPDDGLRPGAEAIAESGSVPAAAKAPGTVRLEQTKGETGSATPAETGALAADREAAAESDPKPVRESELKPAPRRHGGAMPQ